MADGDYDEASVVRASQEDDGRSIAELIAAYRLGPSLVRDAVSDLAPDQLRARPVAGKLSTLEVVGHVADCDQFLADRMKRTIATERPLLVGVDGDTYPEALHYQERDLALQLELLDVTRRQMAADLERLSAQTWSRTAVHSESGPVTLRQLLLHSVRHVERHLEAIAEKRRALGLA